ncbi:MAG: hypothetical protein ACXWT0_01790 [Methylobacter sp.]
MTQQNLINAKTSVALTKDTIVKLKELSTAHNLRMYEVLDTLVSLAYSDDGIKKRIVEETRRLNEEKKKDKVTFVQKVSKLDPKLRDKLRSMSSEDLERLLTRV